MAEPVRRIFRGHRTAEEILQAERDKAQQLLRELVEAVEPVAAVGRGWNPEGNPYALLPGRVAKRLAETAQRIREELGDG